MSAAHDIQRINLESLIAPNNYVEPEYRGMYKAWASRVASKPGPNRELAQKVVHSL